MCDLAFEILVLMDNGNILAAGWCIKAMARRNLGLLSTSFCFRKECNVLHLSATTVHAHHEAGAGKQHQKGEGEGQYGT